MDCSHIYTTYGYLYISTSYMDIICTYIKYDELRITKWIFVRQNKFWGITDFFLWLLFTLLIQLLLWHIFKLYFKSYCTGLYSDCTWNSDKQIIKNYLLGDLDEHVNKNVWQKYVQLLLKIPKPKLAEECAKNH